MIIVKRIALLLFLVFINTNIFAQITGHDIKVKILGVPQNKTCYLAHYYGYNQYIKIDSAKAINGVLNFKGDEKLKGGVYLVVFSPAKVFDVLISGTEQNFEIESDTIDYIAHVKVKDSRENELMFQYRKYLQNKSTEAESTAKEARTTKDPALKMANQAKLSAISKEVEVYMKSFVKQNVGTFTAKVIHCNIEPELPTPPTLPSGKKDSTFLFNYYKKHFFDNIDFSDERILRTPFLQSRLERYFKDLVYQVQDSVIKDCATVLSLAKKNQDVYRYTLWYVTNKYENSEVVGLDGVFVDLAENYYLKDANWLDSTQKATFQQRVNTLKPLQTGYVFPTLIVADSLGKEHSLAEVKTKYTILYFYDPDCGHCKEFAPKLVEYAAQNKGRITIVNVSIVDDLSKMKKFVSTYKTQKILNYWDAKRRYNFKNNFDVYATPTTFILDEQHRILVKHIPPDKFDDFLQYYERKIAKATK